MYDIFSRSDIVISSEFNANEHLLITLEHSGIPWGAYAGAMYVEADLSERYLHNDRSQVEPESLHQ